MKKLLPLVVLASLLLSACSFISPYQVTFTTEDEAVVNPGLDTVDFVLSMPALAYVSTFQCGNDKRVELLPVLSEDKEPEKVHRLNLNMLDGQEPGTRCELEVNAFDRTTTANSTAEISVYVLKGPEDIVIEEPLPVDEEEENEAQVACEADGGTWNSCASPCETDDEVCIEVCVEVCEYPENENTEPATEDLGDGTSEEESDAEPVLE